MRINKQTQRAPRNALFQFFLAAFFASAVLALLLTLLKYLPFDRLIL